MTSQTFVDETATLLHSCDHELTPDMRVTGQLRPRRSTAILILHGIGEQLPFQTLEAFTSTFWNTRERAGGAFVAGEHRARWHNG